MNHDATMTYTYSENWLASDIPSICDYIITCSVTCGG